LQLGGKVSSLLVGELDEFSLAYLEDLGTGPIDHLIQVLYLVSVQPHAALGDQTSGLALGRYEACIDQ
jgi:hypothetical protein